LYHFCTVMVVVLFGMSDIPFGSPESFGEQDPADCSDAPDPDFDFSMDGPIDDTEGDWPAKSTEDLPCLAPIDEQLTLNPMTIPDDIGHEGDPEPVAIAPEVIPGLSFIVPHDGAQAEVSSAEQVLVARAFNALVDDVLFGCVDSLGPSSDYDPGDSILLKLPVSETDYLDIGVDSRVEMHLSGKTPPSADAVLKNITVQRCTSSMGHALVNYMLGVDEVVRRYTNTGENIDLAQFPMIDSDNPDDVARVIQSQIDELDNVVTPNWGLERGMGCNFQPVGMQEFYGLADLVARAVAHLRRSDQN
jgi:hypothetical protein